MGDDDTGESWIVLGGVLTWADGVRRWLNVLVGVLTDGVVDDRGASAMLCLGAIVTGLQLREFRCMSSVLGIGASGGIDGAWCMSSRPIEAGQRFVGSIVFPIVFPRAPDPGVNGVTGLKEMSSAKLRESVRTSNILNKGRPGILGFYIELI